MPIFISMIALLLTTVGVGYICSYRLYLKKQRSGAVGLSDKIKVCGLSVAFSLVQVFLLSVTLEFATLGIGLSDFHLNVLPAHQDTLSAFQGIASGAGLHDVYSSALAAYEVVLSVLCSVPSGSYIRSTGLTILCFVPSLVVYFVVCFFVSVFCGKKVDVGGSGISCVFTDSQMNRPVILSFSFIPALVALFIAISGYTGFTSTITSLELSDSRVRYLKNSCEFGVVTMTNTKLVCDNKVVSSKRTGIDVFNADDRHVLILLGGLSGDTDYEHQVIIRESTVSELMELELLAKKLIDAHLSGF